ncbi:MAG: hypothetical protein JW841_15475 [Deltaproteobacteria bacterium]|nr:hypothetical protein [Deltaproteobacteria bacterium]
MSTVETLGSMLVREEIISRTQLYDALRLQRENGRLLGTCLLQLGHIDPNVLLKMLSQHLDIPALPAGCLHKAAIEAVQRVPREIAFRLRIVPFSWDEQILGLAITDSRVLTQLNEVAYHARAAVGVYLGLEIEIETVLPILYQQ